MNVRKPLSLLVLGALSALIATLGVTPALAAADDTEVPSYVDNVAAVAGDGEVLVSWDAATDDVEVTGYKIYYGTESVDEAGESYNMGFVEVGDVLESTVTGLENDMTYYFAVTAVDPTGNESLEYSVEVSATPSASEDDGNPPSVASTHVTNCTVVEVTFSEVVTLPETDAAEAFEIENFDTLQYLDVTEVAYGDTHAVVVLTTATMEEDAQYLLTVGTEIEDAYGNPIVSGTTDTGSFKGIACVEDVPEEDDVEDTTDDTPEDDVDVDTDADAPTLEDASSESLTEILLTFDEEVVLPEAVEGEDNEALNYFDIYDENNTTIEVLDVQYYEEESTSDDQPTGPEMKVLVLTTAEQSSETNYFVVVTGLEDASGNATEGDATASGTFTSVAATEEETDTIAPEDVTDLVSEVADLVVNLSWASSVNSAGDLVDQILYVSNDGGSTYEKIDSIGTDTEYTYESGVEGETYTFKVTAVDSAGNESAGALVTAILPTTGPGLIALAAASLLGGGILGRKKRKQ